MTAPRLAVVAPDAPVDSMARKLLTVDEAAHAWHISSRFCRQLVARGAVASVRIGRSVRITSAELERVTREGVAP